MAVLNIRFIASKTSLKIILNTLNEKQLVQINQINNKTIYYIDDLQKITIYKNTNKNSTASKILNITDVTYIGTALFHGVSGNNHDSQIQIIYLIVFCHLFQLPTIVFCKLHEIKTSCDKNYIIKKFIKKYQFIKKLINNITITLTTTPKQIHIDYTNHLHSYKQLLQKKLQTLITKKNDSTLTIDELTDLILQPNNQQIQTVTFNIKDIYLLYRLIT